MVAAMGSGIYKIATCGVHVQRLMPRPMTAKRNIINRYYIEAAAVALLTAFALFAQSASAAELYNTGVGTATATECTGSAPCYGGQSWQNGGGLTGTAKFGRIGVTCANSGTATGGSWTMKDSADELGSTIGTCTLDAGQTVTAGVATFLDCTFATPLNLSGVGSFYLATAVSDGTAQCKNNITASNVEPGNFKSNAGAIAGQDQAFAFADSGGWPAPSPVTTVVYPENDGIYHGFNVPMRFATDVCEYNHQDLEPYFDAIIEKAANADCTGDWTYYGIVAGSTPEFFTAGSYGSCAEGLTYGYGSFASGSDLNLNAYFPTGCYRIQARVQFPPEEYGDWSDYSQFQVITPYGGGSTDNEVTWSGGDATDGGEESWDTYFDAVPTHDDVYGACKLFGFDFNFLGTGESESASGDGLPCLWSWIKYGIKPPGDALFNYVSKPFAVLGSRWPFVYATNFYTQFQQGIAAAGTCPLPSIPATEFGESGVSTPEVDFCDWVSPVAGYIEGTGFETIIVYIIYITLAGFALDSARAFFSA